MQSFQRRLQSRLWQNNRKVKTASHLQKKSKTMWNALCAKRTRDTFRRGKTVKAYISGSAWSNNWCKKEELKVLSYKTKSIKNCFYL